MALTSTWADKDNGFQWKHEIQKDEVLWVPGDPGDTFTKGDLVTFTAGEGIADPLAADEVPYGVVMETVVCPSLGTSFPTFAGGPPAKGWGQVPDDNLKTLVAIRPFIPVGTPILWVTFANQVDDTVSTYLGTTPYIGATTGNGADDRPNGALVYVYEGPGIGEWNVIADYDHADGAVELLIILHRAFAATLTSASKYIVLSGEADTNKGIGFFGRIEAGDQDNLDTADGANDGDFTVYADARTISEHLKNLRLPVIPSGAFLMA